MDFSIIERYSFFNGNHSEILTFILSSLLLISENTIVYNKRVDLIVQYLIIRSKFHHTNFESLV